MKNGLFLASLAASCILAAAQVWEFASGASFPDVYKIAACWLVLFAVSLVAFRLKGLWLLTSAPLAFLPAVLIALYSYECMREHSCL